MDFEEMFEEMSKGCPWQMEVNEKVVCKTTWIFGMALNNMDQCKKENCAVFHFVKNSKKGDK